jgi:hypothetical protein
MRRAPAGTGARADWRMDDRAQNAQCGPGASSSARNGAPTGAMITLMSTAG